MRKLGGLDMGLVSIHSQSAPLLNQQPCSTNKLRMKGK